MIDLIFLDIDGVLNSEQSAVFWNREGKDNGGFSRKDPDFCPIASSNLLSLFEDQKDLKIVVSSTWRLGTSVEDLGALIEKQTGIAASRVIDKTPAFRDGPRGKEIKHWLDNTTHQVRRFAILDDDSDMDVLLPYLKHTDWRHGLTRRDYYDLMDYFRAPWAAVNGYTFGKMKEKGLFDQERAIYKERAGEMIEVRYYGLGEPKDLLDQTLEAWAIAKEEDGVNKWQGYFVKHETNPLDFLGGRRPKRKDPLDWLEERLG